MKGFGSQHPTDGIEVPPDTVGTLILTAGTASVADWPAGIGIVCLSALSTAGATLNGWFNPVSTAANIPSTASSATTQTSNICPIVPGFRYFQVSTAATGFSFIANSSGVLQFECWKKGG